MNAQVELSGVRREFSTGRGTHKLSLRVLSDVVWAGLYDSDEFAAAVAFTSTDRYHPRTYVYSDSLIVGATHFVVAPEAMPPIVEWLRTHGVTVEIEGDDADCIVTN